MPLLSDAVIILSEIVVLAPYGKFLSCANIAFSERWGVCVCACMRARALALASDSDAGARANYTLQLAVERQLVA